MTKVSALCLLLAGTCVSWSSGAPVRAIRYESFVNKKRMFHVVHADMSQDLVAAETMHERKLVSVWKMIGKKQPAAAITGTFFAPRSQKPVADVLVDGELVARGERGSVLAVDWFGRVSIFDAPFQQSVDWYPYRYALRGAVRVIHDGRIQPNPKAQHFRDPRIWGRAARTAVGTTSDGRLVMMATPNAVTLSDIGRAMASRGVTNCVALDGGGSTMLYYRGSLVVPPKRLLNNIFILHERSPFDAAFRERAARIAVESGQAPTP